ncbi:uncharacterized protein LOC129950558 [Eupeodes corollae]|uniref:uncharacterized protein LOC129950558 n=1 Tax=Eupeodes corollae TaxID=290404 RepID=UPI00248FB881|nr:uncharacterized protein LOC129950558 [Eupeodes corollae]
MNDRWMQGPQFLYMKEEDWPYTSRENYHAISEVVSVIPTSKFESWGKLLRVTAYVCRYMDALRGIKRENLALSSEVFQRAERVLYRHIQAESLLSELEFAASLRKVAKKTAQCSSIILSMKPYLNENGVMRSMSRINNAKWLNIYTRHPVILPDNNRATRLLIRHYHDKFRHIVVNEIRKKYFIPKLRQLLIRVRKHCFRCKMNVAKATPPEMAILPEVRVSAFTPPFSYSTVDYGGPFDIVHGRKIEKRWICLFTCLVTRAIHIEIAYTCSTDSFILCYRNFLCRRGTVRKMFSDRGTNFIGAEKLLKTT